MLYSIERRLVTDTDTERQTERQTDRHGVPTITAPAERRAVKIRRSQHTFQIQLLRLSLYFNVLQKHQQNTN